MFNKILNSNFPVLIAGATASGKSALALKIAQAMSKQKIPCCIINADALQVYKDWKIMTARPWIKDTMHCLHYLYGHVALDAPYSVGHWLRQLHNILDIIKQNNMRPLIVGGTGLYFQALTCGLSKIPMVDSAIKQAADKLALRYGVNIFARDLHQIDPETYAKIDIKNPVRARRAWEVLRTTGRGLAQWHAEIAPPLLPQNHVIALHICTKTEWLNARITARFKQMLTAGALEECQAVLHNGWDVNLPSCQVIGAKYLIAYLRGELSLNKASMKTIIQTRQYAKRQRTWFRSKMANWHQVNYNGVAL